MRRKAMRQTIHDWRMHLKPDQSLDDLSRIFNPVLHGWITDYGRFDNLRGTRLSGR